MGIGVAEPRLAIAGVEQPRPIAEEAAGIVEAVDDLHRVEIEGEVALADEARGIDLGIEAHRVEQAARRAGVVELDHRIGRHSASGLDDLRDHALARLALLEHA